MANCDWNAESRRRSPRCIAESTDETGRNTGVGVGDVFDLNITNDPERRASTGTAGLGRFARTRESCRIFVRCFRSKDRKGANGRKMRTKYWYLSRKMSTVKPSRCSPPPTYARTLATLSAPQKDQVAPPQSPCCM